MSADVETIVAVATAPGMGGIGIVRVSGPMATAITTAVCGTVPPPRQAQVTSFRDADQTVIDRGLALYFPSPNSFTGEDVIELHAHGGPVILDWLLSRCIKLGARAARPGEFSERAFLNDKLDLLQAEAVADLIEAGTRQSAQAATRSLDGQFSTRVNELLETLTHVRMYVEAAIDFPEEEVDFLSDASLTTQLDELQEALESLLASAKVGRILTNGFHVVLAGPPNAGKSTLLNAMTGYDAAIVTAIPGTTRDTLKELVQYQGMPFHLTDTAGLRDTDDEVELVGISRAKTAMEKADHVLLLCDSREPSDALQAARNDIPASIPLTWVRTKADLGARPVGITEESEGTAITLSAQTGEGLTLLWDHLVAQVNTPGSGEGTFSARARHLSHLEAVLEHLDVGRAQLRNAGAGELLAEELRLAQLSLGELTGEFTSDDLLGKIFSSFCIGK